MRILLLLCYLALVGIASNSSACLAQESKSSIVIPLKSNKYISIQACTDQIFRIRISAKPNFPESLMERYGILKNDWGIVNVTLKKEYSNTIIQTKGFQLQVNENTGNISVRDLKGMMVIRNVNVFGDEKESVINELRTSLSQYFDGGKLAEGIIGDSQNTGIASEGLKSAGQSESSVLEVSLSPGERFYAGGSTSRTNIQHRGTALRMWATYQKTEIPMPFIMSSEGWGIFNNTTSLNYFDIGRFQKDKLFVYNTCRGLDFYLMLGTSMDEIINLYTTITGKPYLLPKWAYGLAFGGNTLEDQMDIMNDAVRFRDEKIPCDIYWLEPQWMSVNYDFTSSKNWNLDKFRAEPFWELNKFPKYENPMLFIAKLHNLGFKLALWLCIDHDLSIEEEDQIAEKACQPQSGLEHWFLHLTKFMDQGVDGFKLDPGRTLDEHPDRKYYNGYTDKEMHNMNQILLPKQMYGIFRKHKGIRSFHHYCGGYSGTQHWGASTSGDNGGGRDALFDQLNLGLSGFVNTSADVMDVFSDNKAAMHFGFFLPWVQVNSWYGLHHPWYLKPDEKETFRYYAQLRNSLFPYIYSAAIQGSQTGMPILRAMPLVFPDDRNVDNIIYQYMFGENLLVSVFSDSIYLPQGIWTNYWTGEKNVGGKTIHCKVPENSGGLLFIRGGAIIPYQQTMQYIGEHPVDTLILKVFPQKQSSYTLWEDDGRSFDFEKGIIAKTKFECIDFEEETEFIISPCQGSYSGIPGSRTFQLEIETPHKPAQVLINGSKTENWKYDSSGKVILSVYQKQIREKQVIRILKF
jgi:alpha-glucosidase